MRFLKLFFGFLEFHFISILARHLVYVWLKFMHMLVLGYSILTAYRHIWYNRFETESDADLDFNSIIGRLFED